MNAEDNLIHKLICIEALYSGAKTAGEKNAAANAKQRIQERLKKIQENDPPVEYKFTMPDMWSRKLFVALLRRYEMKPYRYYRQKHTTVMVKVSKRFVDETLWPEFQELDDTLRLYLDKVSDRVISESIHSDNSEAEIVQKLIEK